MSETYRITRDNFWLGIILVVVCMLGFPILIVLGVNEAVPDRRVYAAIFFVAAFGMFMAFALWPLVAYMRMRLVLSDSDIEVHGIVRTVRISFADVTEVNWNSLGGILLTTATEQVRIQLMGYYPREVCVRLARDIQSRCPHATQKRWDLFCMRTSPPERKPLDAPLTENEVRLTRRLWAKYFLCSSIVFFLLGCLGWRFLGKPQGLAAPLLLLPLWGMLHFLTPKDGIVCRRHSREESAFHWFQLMVFVVFFGGFMAIQQETKHWANSSQLTVQLPFVALGLAIWSWKFVPFLKRQEQEWTRLREESLDKWDEFLCSSTPGRTDVGTKSP